MQTEESYSFKSLTKEERAFMIIYAKKLLQDRPFEEIKPLIIKANEIHEKYPEFCISDAMD